MALVLAGWLTGLTGRGTAAPAEAASGTDAYTVARQRMVAEQLVRPGRDITNARVLAVMGKVPRHEFVPERLRPEAYADHPLPIGEGQTISQPYIVAFMTERLEPKPTDRVLEIGTGSGYQAAVLAELVKEVYSIELVEPLARRAQRVLAELGYTNIKIKVGNGYEGWVDHAPYDAIIVTAAPAEIPERLVEQMKMNGRMILPVGVGSQDLILVQRTPQGIAKRYLLPVRFVPMIDGKRKVKD